MHRDVDVDLDVDGLSRNPSPSEEDITRAKWHGNCYGEVVPGWHATAYHELMSDFASILLDQGSNEESNRAQVVSDV